MKILEHFLVCLHCKMTIDLHVAFYTMELKMLKWMAAVVAKRKDLRKKIHFDHIQEIVAVVVVTLMQLGVEDLNWRIE